MQGIKRTIQKWKNKRVSPASCKKKKKNAHATDRTSPRRPAPWAPWQRTWRREASNNYVARQEKSKPASLGIKSPHGTRWRSSLYYCVKLHYLQLLTETSQLRSLMILPRFTQHNTALLLFGLKVKPHESSMLLTVLSHSNFLPPSQVANADLSRSRTQPPSERGGKFHR